MSLARNRVVFVVVELVQSTCEANTQLGKELFKWPFSCDKVRATKLQYEVLQSVHPIIRTMG